MRKIFLNQEKGIVMSIVPMAMVILLALAVAFFVATQNEMSKSMASTSGIMSLNVSNGGAERAIWYIQEQLDRDPNWRPQNGKCLFGGNYDELIKEKDPAKYEKYGIHLMPSGKGTSDKGRGVGLYATKMVHEDDPTTRDDEWVLYSTGVMRVPSLLGLMSSFKKVEQEKILIRIGNQVQEFPPHSIHAEKVTTITNGLLYLYPDEEGNSIIYSREETDEVVDYILPIRAGQFYYGPSSEQDGYRGRFDYRTSSNKKPVELEKAAEKNPNITIRTNVTPYSTPVANLDFFKSRADYIFRNGQVQDGTGELVDHSEKMVVKEEGNFRVYKIRNMILKTTSLTPVRYSPEERRVIFEFHDINGDGQTVLYIEDGALRCEDGFIEITPRTRGVIVTRGKWVNTAEFDDDFTSPRKGYYDENNIRNENIGMDLRTGIYHVNEKGEMWEYVKKGSGWVQNPVFGDLTYRTPLKTPTKIEELIGFDKKDLGSLDLFSEYDIFIGPDYSQIVSSGGSAMQHTLTWKGFIYSKGSIMNYADMVLKGAIISGKKYLIGGQGKLTKTVLDNYGEGYGRSYNDGADLVLGYENINGTRDYFNNVFVGGQRGGNGRLEIIAWQRL